MLSIESWEPGCLKKPHSQPNMLALATQALDPGEAEVNALTLELDTRTLSWMTYMLSVLRSARCSSLQPFGTLGLFLASRRAWIIRAVSPEIEALRKVCFHACDALV